MHSTGVKSAVLCLLSAILTAAALLAACRVFVERRGDPLERSWSLIEFDGQLGWKVKPLLKTTFYGKTVTTDADGFRRHAGAARPRSVLVAGPSSTFGWGVSDEETYPAQLDRLLDARRSDLQAINLGQIGYTIRQGLIRTAPVIRKTRPAFLVVAYGINELDYLRFFDADGTSDDVFFAHGPVAAPWTFLPWMLLNKRTGAWKLDRGAACPPRFSSVRVPAAQFLDDLDRFKKMADEARARMILVSTVYRPAKARSEVSAADYDVLRNRMNEAVDRGRCADAADLFRRLREEEPARISAGVAESNERAARWAERNRVGFVDLGAALNENDFVDSVHFSVSGNSKAAQALLDRISSK